MIAFATSSLVGSSPLTRGKPRESPITRCSPGLIPAHAGKTPAPGSHHDRRQAHPRSRGENTIRALGNGRLQGSSPLTRGKPSHSGRHSIPIGLIPAHAGKTTAFQLGQVALKAHPRSRGENVKVSVVAETKNGSSPLTRGKLYKDRESLTNGGLIPAHAGKTWHGGLYFCDAGAHPRSRGENAKHQPRFTSVSGSSPLTRGKRRKDASQNVRRRLIPAHAGKTRPARNQRARAWAHPRSRGENGVGCAWMTCAPGSSPLTRGKQRIRPTRLRGAGLIPAHAGKTQQWRHAYSGDGAHPRSRGENHCVPRFRGRQ